MDYKALKTSDISDLLRGRLIQAEADHLVHSLDHAELKAQLDAMPAATKDNDPNTEARTAAQTNVDRLVGLTEAAEKRAELVKAKLDELQEPYVAPETPPPSDPSVVEKLAELLVAQNVISQEEADALTPVPDIAPFPNGDQPPVEVAAPSAP